MPFTYTFTARNIENPDQVMTFTIFDDMLRVNLSGWDDEMVEMALEKDRQGIVKDFLAANAGSALYKAIERLSGPIHINDVTPSFQDGQFRLTLWKRVAGLRLAPISITIGNVDNPQGAGEFIATLMDRQDQTESPGFFSGPLDYWATWVIGLVGIVFLLRWPKKRKMTDG